MTQAQRPLFVVGTEQEEARAASAGYIAQSIHGMDAGQICNMVLEVGGRGRSIILLISGQAEEQVAGACGAAMVPCYCIDSSEAQAYAAAIESYESAPEMLSNYLRHKEAEAMRRVEADRAAIVRRRLASLGVHDVFDVITKLASGEADRAYIPTGLQGLDRALGGGLQEGTLCALGAMSSTGKTTIALQIADTIAESGRPVLFVSVEMGRYEITAKSISRLMRLAPKHNGGYHTASSWEIQSAEARAKWGAERAQAFTAACTHYSANIAPYMHLMETDEQPTAAQIRQAAEGLQALSGGVSPIVFVDYLQLLSPASDRMTEKQATDENVRALRCLARDLQTCVVVISSLNRASYTEGVDMSAFKESGGIEFTADLVLGMQPRGYEARVMGVAEGKRKAEGRKAIREYKGKKVRAAEVVILKNRLGNVPSSPVNLLYEARTNLFTDDTTAPPAHADGYTGARVPL